jgi:hypothetical protein
MYDNTLRQWCKDIRELASRLDFEVSSRGWCYVLEEYGLAKGDFDKAQRLINDCRKSGLLPVGICAEDEGRSAHHVESLDDETPEEFACGWVEHVRNNVHRSYQPISFWDELDVYIQMTVEKIDLRNLFDPICAEYHVPILNISGWADINSRIGIMTRFAEWERRGKRCALLHCGDHDPGGLHISEQIRSNLNDLADAVGWHPDNLIIDRFGLNAEFIERHGLTWIDNLETGSGGRLDDPQHPDHGRPYVQNYLREFGTRKVEANALVVRARCRTRTLSQRHSLLHTGIRGR